MSGYNGHRSWAAWNVCLWMHNDEDLYRLMRECMRRARTRQAAARRFLELCPERTADGAAYTLTSVREAMRD